MEELEVMRQQMARLEEQVEKQAKVVDKFLRGETLKKVRHLNQAVWTEGIACAFAIIFCNWLFHWLGCSWWFIAGTTLLMIASFLSTFISHRWVKEDEIMSGDLLQVAQQLRRLHKWYKDSLKIEIPIMLVYLAWAVWEIYHVGDITIFDININLAPTMCIGLLVGGVIGGLIGLLLHKSYMREMDDIINQIEGE